MRVPSFHDWGWNTLGTFSGAVVHRQLAALGPWIRRTATVLVDDGPVPRLAVAVVGVWAAGQLFPFVPSPDVGNLRAGLRPVWHVLRGSASFEPSRGLGYALAILGLWIILSSALRSEYRRCFFVGVFFFCVLLAKVPVVRQQLSLEALAGAGLTLLVVAFLREPARATSLACAAIAGAVVLDQLRPGGGGAAGVSAFN